MIGSSTLERAEADLGRSERLVCKACGHVITDESYRTTKAGASSHTFANPAGYIYRIGCFSRAPGVQIVGDYTKEFSWFSGYGWCYSVCAACYVHLGWHFSGTQGVEFFGLIMDNLRSVG